jgi:hypothetical protein
VERVCGRRGEEDDSEAKNHFCCCYVIANGRELFSKKKSLPRSNETAAGRGRGAGLAGTAVRSSVEKQIREKNKKWFSESSAKTCSSRGFHEIVDRSYFSASFFQRAKKSRKLVFFHDNFIQR